MTDGLEFFSVAFILGTLYGFIAYGTPLLPRRVIRYFMQTAGTATIALSFWRNAGDSEAPLTRVLPTMIWFIAITLGAYTRSAVQTRWVWADTFAGDIEEIEESIENTK